MKALIFQGKVVDLHVDGFPVSPELVWIDAPDGTARGDLHDGTHFTKPQPSAADEAAIAQMKLKRIDLLSIRAIREYIVSKPDAPKEIKDREAEAQSERAKGKK